MIEFDPCTALSSKLAIHVLLMHNRKQMDNNSRSIVIRRSVQMFNPST